MTAAFEAQRFRSWIERRLGLEFEEAKLDFLAEVLDRRARRAGVAPGVYLNRLGARNVCDLGVARDVPGSPKGRVAGEAADAEEELRALALELTVPETYFFRHVEQFRALEAIAVEAARASPGRGLRILSAGCASGEEPYSLAILLRDRLGGSGESASIRALDINPAMLAKARRGIYSSWALRETPRETQRRWFREAAGGFELDPAIRGAVTFDEVNLAEEDARLFAPRTYDVIFCRNVLMYFGAESARGLVARLTRSLEDNGYLFLGHAETLRGLSKGYHLCHTHGTFYYRRKHSPSEIPPHEAAGWTSAQREDGGARAAPGSSIGEGAAADQRTTAAGDGGALWTQTWLETVAQASDRIRALAESPAKGTTSVESAALDTAGRPKSGASGEMRVQSALALLKGERFLEALDALGAAPVAALEDPDVSLLRAALLVHSGNLEAARQASTELLERDEFNSGAHYLLALCHEGLGDRPRAIEHDQSAAYLDAGFAMPRLHLGFMARRAGEHEAARRELRQALVLIEREDPSRLLLFGGGFGREALIALCRAELAAVEGVA